MSAAVENVAHVFNDSKILHGVGGRYGFCRGKDNDARDAAPQRCQLRLSIAAEFAAGKDGGFRLAALLDRQGRDREG